MVQESGYLKVFMGFLPYIRLLLHDPVAFTVGLGFGDGFIHPDNFQAQPDQGIWKNTPALLYADQAI